VRVIDCDCGDTLQAANDEDLTKVLAAHREENHERLKAEQVRQLVAQRAYDATDS
jgi:hypothetical protein